MQLIVLCIIFKTYCWVCCRVLLYCCRAKHFMLLCLCTDQNEGVTSHNPGIYPGIWLFGFCNDQIPHTKSKNEVQMPYIPQLSGGQMPHCTFNFKVKVLQLSTSPVHQSILVQPILNIIALLWQAICSNIQPIEFQSLMINKIQHSTKKHSTFNKKTFNVQQKNIQRSV